MTEKRRRKEGKIQNNMGSGYTYVHYCKIIYIGWHVKTNTKVTGYTDISALFSLISLIYPFIFCLKWESSNLQIPQMVHWELLARQSADTKQKDKAIYIYILNKKPRRRRRIVHYFLNLYNNKHTHMTYKIISPWYPNNLWSFWLIKKKKKHPATGIEKDIPTKLLYPKNNNWIVYVPRKSSPSLKGYWLRIIRY